jgi:hypothetical protein
VVFAAAGALVGVVPDAVSAAATRGRCRATAFVPNCDGNSVSTTGRRVGAAIADCARLPRWTRR